MALFEPIIGSGFDQIAAQRFGWGQQNLATETGNVNRFTQAQEQADAKARYIAQLNQQAADQQTAAEIAQQKFAEGQRQFDVGTQENRFNLERSKQSEDERTAYLNNALEKQRADAADYASTVDEVAKTKSQDAHDLKTAAADARKAFYDATAQIDTKGTELQSKNPNIAYDPKMKGFVPKVSAMAGATQDQIAIARTAAEAAANAANQEMAKTKSDYDTAKAEHLFHQQNASDFEKNLETKYGLLVRHNGDKWEVYNPQTRKSYSGVPPATNRFGFTPVMGARAMADEASMPGARFNTDTGVPNPQPNPIPTPPQIRVKSVVPVGPSASPVEVSSQVVPPASPAPSTEIPNPPPVPVGNYAPVYNPAPAGKPEGMSDVMYEQMNSGAPAASQPAPPVAIQPTGPLRPGGRFAPYHKKNSTTIPALSVQELSDAAKQLGIRVNSDGKKFWDGEQNDVSRDDVQRMVIDAAEKQGFYVPYQ